MCNITIYGKGVMTLRYYSQLVKCTIKFIHDLLHVYSIEKHLIGFMVTNLVIFGISKN